MRNLINFLIRYSSWIIFIIYVALSCIMLFSSNPYQHHIYITSANRVSATIYSWANNVTSYFHLKEINDDLLQRNANLELENIALRSHINRLSDSITAEGVAIPPQLRHYEIRLARVINNSITRPHNFLTIDKGSADGIVAEMGVLDHNGVVGIVERVEQHYSRVISILNPDLSLSCKIKNSGNIGSLVWDGKSPYEAVLEELPRHAIVSAGDTIITSEHSGIFPEGVPVGVVIDKMSEDNDNFFALRIRLLSDFTALNAVKIINNTHKDEIKAIENVSRD